MISNAERPLGKIILSHLRSTSRNAWSIDSLSAVQALFCANPRLEGIADKAKAAEKALHLWTDTLPASDATRIRAAMPRTTSLFLGVMLPALVVWAREQDWRAKVDTHNIALVDLKLVTVSSETLQCSLAEHLEACAMATEVTKDIIEEVTDKNAAWTLVGPWLMSAGYSLWPREESRWESERLHRDAFFDIWLNLAVAGQRVDNIRQVSDLSTSLGHRWKTALLGPWPHLGPQDECILMRKFVHSPLVDNLKRGLCSLALHASTLADPIIRNFIEMHLPSDESARLDALSWSTTSRQFNEDVARIYVPHTASLVNILGRADVWGDVEASKSLLKSLTERKNDIPVMALPAGILEEDTPET